MCNIWQRYRDEPGRAAAEMGLDDIIRLFSNSRQLSHLNKIRLTGGEPFLHPEFVEICQFLTRHLPNVSFDVTTNGLNTSHIMENLSRLAPDGAPVLDNIIISMDGLGSLHDEIRGVGRAFDRAMETALEIGHKYPELNLGFAFTISPDNYSDLQPVYELAQRLGASFSMRFAQTSDAYYANQGQSFAWTEQKLDAVTAAIEEVIVQERRRHQLRQFLTPQAFFFSHMVDQVRQPRRLFKCFSGTHSCFIDPYGDVYPCINLDKKLGNVRETSFDSLWLDEEAARLRHFIAAGKCNCWTECETIPSLQRQWDFVGDNLRWLVGRGSESVKHTFRRMRNGSR
jgi:radical SAM protein with 4Fe4S-binding SPASM domain